MPTPDSHHPADATLPSESPADLNRKILEPSAQSGPAIASDRTIPDGPPGPGAAFFEGADANSPNSLPKIPGYMVEAEIARGGMGVVYRARNLRLNRPAAIKMIIGGKCHDPMARVRFVIEAEAIAQLDHPHVVQVHEFGTHENLPFFAQEFVAGGSLVEKLSREGKPAPRAAAELVLKLAEGIAAAHAKGIIHRDLKPANVLLTEAGEPKIVDFGLAKVGQSDMTATGAVMGTPSYMSPEQAAGRIREVSVPTDVYALGAILFELLTGRPAFKGESSMETIQQVLTQEPDRPRAIDPAIPRDLETICLKCLEKNAKSRYVTATELAVDLRAFLDGRPVLARPVGHFERAVKWVKRNPVVTGAAAAVVTALTLGTTVSYLKYRDAEEQKGIAEDKRKVADEARQKAEENERAERWGRYRSNIAAASAAMQLHNSGAARMALIDAPAEHRNWEWKYLHSQLDSASLVLTVPGVMIKSFVLSPSGRQIAVCCDHHNEVYLYDVVTGKLDGVLRGHSGEVTSAAYHPDGKQVATGSIDQTIRLWDPATGRQTSLLKAEAAPSNLIEYPLVQYNSDGSRIVSSASRGGDGMSRLWDAANGKEIAILGQWQENTPAAALSPDGKRVAVASGVFVRVCDIVTGRELARLGPHEQPVKHLTYSPNGKRIASAAVFNVFHLWDVESGKEVAALRGYTTNVVDIKFSPDGSRLVSGSSFPDNSARLWDAATGGLLGSLEGHKNEIWAMNFDPSGQRVVTGALDQTAWIWTGRTGKLLAEHTGSVKHVYFNPNGTRVITASDDATIRVWDSQTGVLISVLRGHDGQFSPNESLTFTPDGSRLLSCSFDGTVRVWDMNLAERNGIVRGHKKFVYDVAFSPDGEQVASSAWDGTARLWDATTCQQIRPLNHEKDFITSLAYSGNCRQLVTVERDGCVVLWDLMSQNKARFPVPPFSRNSDSRAAFNPSGTMLAAACQDGAIRFWDVAGGKEIAQLKGHEKVPIDVAFHPDGSMLASSGADGTVRLWDVSTHAALAVLRGHTGRVWRLAFSIDGKLLASGGSDKTICLWDVQSHERLAVIPLGSIVYGVAFSPDGTRLAAACADNTVRLVDVGSRQQVAELRGHTDYVHAVAWSPDGTRLVSGSGDFTLRIWDSLSVQERAKRAEMTLTRP